MVCRVRSQSELCIKLDNLRQQRDSKESSGKAGGSSRPNDRQSRHSDACPSSADLDCMNVTATTGPDWSEHAQFSLTTPTLRGPMATAAKLYHAFLRWLRP